VFIERRFRFPIYIPAPPIPAMTLPTMSVFMLGAAPHSALPKAKVVTLPICSHFTLKIPYALPLRISVHDQILMLQRTYKVNTVAIDPSGNPLPNQVSLEISPNCSTTAPWISAATI
jgi:hypothetical protein